MRDQAVQGPSGPASRLSGPDEPAVQSKAAADATRPGGRADERSRLIPIAPGRVPAGAGRPSGHSDPYKFWSEYFKKHDESSEQLRETIRLLNLSQKFTDVHAALLGYLSHRGSKDREPWMYIALAIVIEELKGTPKDIKLALDYAADAAQRTHNPNDLVKAADRLFLKGYYDRVGALLDEAAEKVPHRSEPLVMSINLAGKTRDPQRMGDSIDRLLSLGWPGTDEYFRRESQKQANELAARLREDGRGPDADSLLARIPGALARDLFVRLTWDGDADYDLIVQEPLGAEAQYATPRTVFGGSIIRNGYGARPDDVYVCPRAFSGDYTIRVTTVYSNVERPPTRLTLETIMHEGTPREIKETHSLDTERPQDRPVVIHLTDGRRTKVLPFLSPKAVIDSMLVDPTPKEAVKASKGPKPKGAPPATGTEKPADGPRP